MGRNNLKRDSAKQKLRIIRIGTPRKLETKCKYAQSIILRSHDPKGEREMGRQRSTRKTSFKTLNKGIELEYSILELKIDDHEHKVK